MTNHFSFEYSPDVQIYHYDFSWLCYGKDGEEPKEQKLNRDKCYKLFDAVMAKYPQYFSSTSSVGYDGAANVYLKYKLETELSNLSVPDVELEDGVKKNFIVTFKGGKDISLALVKEYYSGSKTDDMQRESLQEAIQALHIILKFPSRYSMKALGRLAMFPIDAKRYYLSDWMELALGHRKSLRFSEIGLTLVVDRASAAFLKSSSGLDFLKSIIDLRGRSLSTFIPNPAQIEALRRAFANVKISTDHLGYTKKYVVKDIAEIAANKDTFKLKEGAIDQITVADFYKMKHKIVLKYPNLPCLITNYGDRIPIEICRIVQNQSSQSIKRPLSAQGKAIMIDLTATAPDARFTCLLQAHAQIRGIVNDDLKDFKLGINASPIGVEGIVLNAPRLSYHRKELIPEDGAWNLHGKIFFLRITFDNFGILNFCASQQEGMNFCEAFTEKAYEMGMITSPDRNPFVKHIMNYMEKTKEETANNIMDALTEMKEKGCAFALCFFPDIKDKHNKAIYNWTKGIADTILNFPTQGVTLRSVQRPKVQTIANILAKVNKKLGGVNVILEESIKPDLLQFKKNKIMIIGADVTHPGTEDELQSSVAASVSTYDENHTMFYPSVRVQPKKDGKRIVEVIKDFKSMVQEHLKNFSKVNGSFPDTILYLRDGVSDGQYRQILNEEVIHLKNPFDNKYKPKVTAVVISKRILTRTRPIDPEDAVMKNVPPGTTIDRIITHPSDFDYFQYGHKGIKGTSRPCHYYMLHDDNNLTIDEMSKISYYLCHIFERSTSSTSAPAPVMHAHNLAYKVRQWICSKDLKYNRRGLKPEERLQEEEKITRELNSEFANINADYARSSMFYI